MPSIRLPISAGSLLNLCRRNEDPADNACFDTYADLVVFTAACGFHRFNGRAPSPPKSFLKDIYPIDLAVFKNQNLFATLLLIGLAGERKPDIARDEGRLCEVVEAFADVGCKYLHHEQNAWTPEDFHVEIAALMCQSSADSATIQI